MCLITQNAKQSVLLTPSLQYSSVVEQACADLQPHRLCDYLYSLSETFSKFYTNCQVSLSLFSAPHLTLTAFPPVWWLQQVVGSPEETSRLLLCEATAILMRQCFHLLGITPVHKLWQSMLQLSNTIPFPFFYLPQSFSLNTCLVAINFRFRSIKHDRCG